jgi:hypothetical protein
LHHFVSLADENLRQIGSIRIAFNSRAKIYSQWQDTETLVVKKSEQLDKLKATSRIRTDKVESLTAELEDVCLFFKKWLWGTCFLMIIPMYL